MSTNPGRFDRYELQELLGQGGLAEVWKAFDMQARRYVAIKFFRTNPQADSDFGMRFQREAQTIASLRHPNIVQYYDFSIAQPSGTKNITAYIVMDYVDGGTLADYIGNTSRQGKFPPPADIVRIFLSIGMAVEYAHQRGIVHGQLKPANVLLDKRNTSRNTVGEPVITDFGMVKLLGVPAGNTSGWFGTPVYTSPEQVMGSPADARSDIYSLGIMLYEMCAGTPPFPGHNPATIMMQHINTAPTSPALINTGLPAALTTIIMRCIAKDPAARFPNASALLAALTQYIEQEEKAGAINRAPTDMPIPMNSGQWDYQAQSTDLPTMLSMRGSSSLPGIVTNQGGDNPTPVPYMTPSLPFARSSQPFAAVQSGGPITPMPTSTFAPGQSAQSLPGISHPQPPGAPPFHKPRRRGLWIALTALLILVVIGAGLGAYFAFFPKSAPPTATTPSVVGHAYFASSGLLSSNLESNAGITDQVQVELDNITPPQAGMQLYAWLLNPKSQAWNPIYLGALTINNGTATLTYQDPQHNNLLKSNSRFLITEESAASAPLAPSLNPSAWRYYAEFSEKKPNPADPKSYSLYDHIRHLLADDPKVLAAGLSGGLDIWLYRNTEKILEWAGSARDAQKSGGFDFIRRQLTRIIYYLDGTTYTQLAQDLPGQPLPTGMDPNIAKIGLLTFNAAKQDPLGYLYHIGTRHLHEIVQLPETNADQRTLAIRINQEINVVNTWFEMIRTDVLQLYAMPRAQLLGNDGRTLLNTVATLANTAFVGQIDQQGQVTPGIVQIHYAIQQLATFDIRACTASNPCSVQ